MTRPKQGELKFVGINRDKVAGDVPADWWTDGRNVWFVAGETIRVPGEALFAESGRLFAATFIHYVDTGTLSWWIYGGDGGIGVTDGINHYNITPNTGPGWGAIATKNWVFTAGDINTLPFVNHPERGPYYWDGDVTHRMKPLPGWPAGWTCRVMRSHKNFLLAGNIDTGTITLESQISWSVSAAPGTVPSTWTPAPTNDAGDYNFATPGGPIVDMLDVRDQLLVGKSGSHHVLQYTGGQYVFAGHDLFPTHGLLAPGAWVEAGNRVVFVSGNGAIAHHDMIAIQPIMLGVLQDHFTRQLNREYPSSVFCYFDPHNAQICIAYPVGTAADCREAITLEVATFRPGIRDLPGVYDVSSGLTNIVPEYWDADPQHWDDDDTTWNEIASGYQPTRLVFAGTNLIEQDAATTQIDPVSKTARPMAAYAERAGIDLDDMDYRKTVSALIPRVKGNVGDTLTFTVGGAASDNAPVELTEPIPYVIGQDDHVFFFSDGRLGSIRVESLGGSPWKLAALFESARKSGRW